MKCLLSSLLLASFCGLSSWSVSSLGLSVTQTPDLSVVEGETVRVTCCWTVEFDRIRVQWLKNQSLCDQQHINKVKCQGSLHKAEYNCSTLTFSNITREDSGRYVCKLFAEIPHYAEFEGNGTFITVTAKKNTDENGPDQSGDSSSKYIIIALATLGPLLLITLICFCVLRGKKAKAARVIYETPNVDSEEVEMDKHSTSSSRGSSQWCQVPVYESFDYFEHGKNKDSG